MSGRSARTIRSFSLEVSPDLVLLDIKKSTFQHLTVNHPTPPTPPHPTPAFPFNVLAFPFNVMAFPVTGRSHGLAAAPGHGQVALDLDRVRTRTWGARTRATWPWPGAAARPWERPVTGNAITLNGNTILLNGNAGVGWGGRRAGFSFVTFLFVLYPQ